MRCAVELVRELDAQWVVQLRELKMQQSAYVERAKQLVKVRYGRVRASNASIALSVEQGQPRDGSVNLRELVEDAPAMERIKALRKDCQQLADEKVQVCGM